MQHQLLLLLLQLNCPNYLKVVTLNLLILHWLKAENHPCWKALASCPEAFSEEKGEMSLSFLARAAIPSRNSLEACQQHYSLLPYCRKICRTYNLFNYKASNSSNFGKPSEQLIQSFFTFFITSFNQLETLQTWQSLPASSNNFHILQPFISSTFLASTSFYTTLPQLSLLQPTVGFLKTRYWKENDWGSAFHYLFPKSSLLSFFQLSQ